MIAVACEAYGEELVAYLDGEQPEADRTRIEAHVGTCLACRRELERLRRVRVLLGELRPVEPSAAFEEAMWRRLDVAAPRSGVRRRVVLWGAPAFAAAAVVALASYSLLVRVWAERPGGTSARIAADQRPAMNDTAQVARQATRPATEAAQRDVASANYGDLEQYPPDLVEHPELYLRLPVVRRLDKLEHFEEVRQHHEAEPVGLAPRPPTIG